MSYFDDLERHWSAQSREPIHQPADDDAPPASEGPRLHPMFLAATPAPADDDDGPVFVRNDADRPAPRKPWADNRTGQPLLPRVWYRHPGVKDPDDE